MAWTLTDDIGAYRAAVGSLLNSQPVRYTVLLTVLASLTRLGPATFGDEPPLFGWWPADGVARAAVLRTPPYPMLLTALPDSSADQLAAALAGRGATLPGVSGAEPDASALARAWSDVTGKQAHVHQRQRLYRLGELTAAEPSPEGAARVAVAADIGIVASWHSAFAAALIAARSP